VEAVATVKALLGEVDQGSVNVQRIEETLQRFKQQLTKLQLDQLLAGLDIADKAKTKDDAVGRLR
jgi:hypothetical protein